MASRKRANGLCTAFACALIENGAKSVCFQPYSCMYRRIMSALRATKDTPCAASQSASAAAARAAVVCGPTVSVIFSTPTATAQSMAPEATAMSAARTAAAPEPQAASTFTASVPRRPTQSATSAPRFSCRLSIPESMLPTNSPSTAPRAGPSARSRPASFNAASTASPAITRNDFSQCSEIGVCPMPRMATSRIYWTPVFCQPLRVKRMDRMAVTRIRSSATFVDQLYRGRLSGTIRLPSDLVCGSIPSLAAIIIPRASQPQVSRSAPISSPLVHNESKDPPTSPQPRPHPHLGRVDGVGGLPRRAGRAYLQHPHRRRAPVHTRPAPCFRRHPSARGALADSSQRRERESALPPPRLPVLRRRVFQRLPADRFRRRRGARAGDRRGGVVRAGSRHGGRGSADRLHRAVLARADRAALRRTPAPARDHTRDRAPRRGRDPRERAAVRGPPPALDHGALPALALARGRRLAGAHLRRDHRLRLARDCGGAGRVRGLQRHDELRRSAHRPRVRDRRVRMDALFVHPGCDGGAARAYLHQRPRRARGDFRDTVRAGGDR